MRRGRVNNRRSREEPGERDNWETACPTFFESPLRWPTGIAIGFES